VPGFESIIDQDRPVRILTSFLHNGTIPHALLFTGIEGVGKESTAVVFAMACNCAKCGDGTRSAVPLPNATRPESNLPCGLCKSCRKIEASNHPDIIRIKPSGPVIKINQIRTLRQMLALKPYEASTRVVIISDAQAMNPAAGNALLKMLEEPPARTILILVANQTSDLLPTIVSRCQHLRFKPISKKPMESLLIRKHGLDPGDAEIIATMAGGSMSRALRMYRTQWIKRRNWLIGEMASLTTGSVNHLLAFGEQLSKNKDILQDSLEVMNSWLRDLIVGKLNPDQIINQDLAQQIQLAAHNMSSDSLLKKIETIQSTQNAIRSGTNLRLALEAMVLKLASV
jgi:DNA polymerase-3 subunit delta'